MKNTLLKLAALIVLTSVFKDALAADTASGSSVLPYETWLKTIQKSLTGPVAFSVSLIGIVSCGATLRMLLPMTRHLHILIFVELLVLSLSSFLELTTSVPDILQHLTTTTCSQDLTGMQTIMMTG